MRVLGIEGTAWAASAAVFETSDPTTASADEHLRIESDAYQPDSGGIHPREAAEHMHEAIPRVVRTCLDHARERAREAGEASDDGDGERDTTDAPIDAVAFSRGPGLGPCLRIVGTAARTVAQRFDVPLVGVNHMVAHLEIGRHRSGFSDPICLNASGANAHVLGYRAGRYRVLGETMDTGVGNAIDKFTRHVGWSHPGGPKVEARAREGEYVDLPYVVKGMDFSFSGIMSAAKQAYDDGTPVADVCRGLEETVFAMLAEVSERALSLTDADELVLGGGVGQNDRLQAMLREMCEQRDADFYVPEDRLLRDNAGMIAVLGAKMHHAGDSIAVADSAIDADFRPDEVAVTWRESGSAGVAATGAEGAEDATDAAPAEAGERVVQGAEARVSIDGDRVVKERLPRTYRHPTLDERLRRERTRLEARLTSEARRVGVPTPVIRDVDPAESRIVFECVGDRELRGALTEPRVRDVGRHLALIHDAGFVHGDPTTRNVRIDPERTYLIDFGLGYYTDDAEDHAMDLHVFAQSLTGTTDDAESLREATEAAYRSASEREGLVPQQVREIEGRGRYQ